MSLLPLDLDRYKEWTIQQLYYLLFPYIKDDFMSLKDCENVHGEGNMTPEVSGATGTITHIIQGGSSIFSSIKAAQYRIKSENGESTISSAQESGRFTGRG